MKNKENIFILESNFKNILFIILLFYKILLNYLLYNIIEIIFDIIF